MNAMDAQDRFVTTLGRLAVALVVLVLTLGATAAALHDFRPELLGLRTFAAILAVVAGLAAIPITVNYFVNRDLFNNHR